MTTVVLAPGRCRAKLCHLAFWGEHNPPSTLDVETRERRRGTALGSIRVQGGSVSRRAQVTYHE